MDRLFLTILNMSLTGAFVIAAIVLARLLLKRAPKIVSYSLWAVAGFRLLFPFSFESIYSLIPFNTAPIPPDIATQAAPRIDSGFAAIDNILSGALPATVAEHSANPLQIWTAIGTYVWLLGIALMLIYGIASYIMLKRKMRHVPRFETADSVDDIDYTKGNIYETDEIKSPFVLGIIRPKIYLPCGLAEKEREYIILHEQTHIRRHDHIIKFVAYFVLCLHWFNPLAWVAYILMTVDMELSCDERVLKEIDDDGIKKDYSLSLLMLSANRPKLRSSPLAFSENGLKTRIKNVLKYKKYSRITIIAAAALAIALGVGLALNAIGNSDNDDDSNIAADNIAAAELQQPNERFGDIELRPVDDAETHSITLRPAPDETPEYVIITGQRFETDITEITLDSRRVTDADLEQLRYMTNLQNLRMFPHLYLNPGLESNDGIINLELISELTSLTFLQIMCDVAVDNLRDISPLAKLTNLRSLIILGHEDVSTNNQISDLSPLESLTMLMFLHIDVPNVDDISPLARIPNLSFLGLSNPQISDFSVLTEMTRLSGLILNYPIISDFSFLAEMNSLRNLQIISEQFNDLSVLSEMSSLQFLDLQTTPISDISPLTKLTNLTYLNLAGTGISDISALSELTNLEILGLTNNSVSDISSLAELTNLESIWLSSNQVSDISPLAGLINLEMLDIQKNEVSDLTPLADLGNLTRLWLLFNPIEDVSPLLGLTNLEFVSLSYQQGFGAVRDLRAALPNVFIDTGYQWG